MLFAASLRAEPEPARQTVLPAPADAPSLAAPNTPKVATAQLLPTTPMLGPYVSLQDYCIQLRKTGSGECEAGRGPFARGWKRGPRGPFISATTLVVKHELGPHKVETCHVALRTKHGHYLSADSTTCEGPASGEQRKTALNSMHWLDQLGVGVLALSGDRLRRVRVDEARWWGQIYSESDVWEGFVQFCGMLPSGVPACSAPLASGCGKDTLQPLQLQGNELVSTASADTRRYCSGEVLATGRYALPFTGLLPAATVLASEPSETESEAPPEPAPLIGPFRSLQQYCAEPTTTFDPLQNALSPADDSASLEFDAEPGARSAPYRWVADPLSNEPRCDLRKGPWNARKLRAPKLDPHLEGPNSLLAVDLLRMQGDMAGAAIEQCRIALTTRAGVFVHDSTATCQGLVGPDSTIETRVLDLRWLDAKSPTRIARIDIENTVYERTQGVVLCGVGPSGVPSCAGRYPLQCLNGEASVVRLALRVENGFVHLTPTGKAVDPDVPSFDDCSQFTKPLPLSFP